MKDSERDHWHAVGRAAGLEEASKHVSTLAMEAFGRGQDKAAQMLRAQSRLLMDRAREASPVPLDEYEDEDIESGATT